MAYSPVAGGGAAPAATTPYSSAPAGMTADFTVNVGGPPQIPYLPQTKPASALINDLVTMTPAQILALQDKMIAAGLLPKSARSGVADSATRAAYGEILQTTSAYNHSGQYVTPDDILGRMVTSQAGQSGDLLGTRPIVDTPTRLDTYNRSDPARIRLTAEAAFREALGRKPTAAELGSFVKHFQDVELNTNRQGTAAQDASTAGNLAAAQAKSDADYAAKGGTAPTGEVGVEQFMQALSGQESGGNANATNARTGASGLFQIMPSNWASWAKEAGLPANAPKTAENQQLVARHKLQSYKDQFGSWDAVAVAWYAGPGAVKGYLENPNASRYVRKQGKGNEPSINDYVAQVRSRLGAAPAAAAPGANSIQAGASIEGMTPAQELQARLAALIADAPGKVKLGALGRSLAEQQRLYDLYKAGKGNKAAVPGTSKHGTGEANDLQYGDANTRQWVLDHAHEYGLVFPVSGENWHVEVAHGQKAQFGPKKGVRLGSTGLPGGAQMPAPVNNGQPLSTSVSITQPDMAAQATEFARNAHPAETQAYDIGQQFNTMVGLLGKSVV